MRAIQMNSEMNCRWQMDMVASAVLKLDMMGLTPENGMVECPPPKGINPFRWKAMVVHAYKILILEKGNL